VGWFRFSLIFLLGAQVRLPTAKLKPAAIAAFDRYAAKAETKMQAEPVKEPGLKGAELKIESALNDDRGKAGAMIQDWVGRMFIPGATLAEVKSVMQDYGDYKNFYKPKIIDSEELAHHEGEFDVFLRMYEKHVLTVVLNTEYHIRYAMPDPQELTIASRSIRIAEVRDPDRSYADELPVGDDSGFLWRLNSYWHFEQADGGVYARCEAISLSREVPFGVGWILNGFLESFPKESMMNTLRGTQAAVEARRAVNAH
jgi:hypothetical protein